MGNRTVGNGLQWILLFVVSVCLVPASQAASLSEYRAVVVRAKAPVSVLKAAQDLQYHLSKISGREFPLLNSKPENIPGALNFYVGSGFWPEHDTRAAKMESEGYLLTSVPGGLLLSGSEGSLYSGGVQHGSGVYHAVSLFLQEQCGVDWLWPGESGEVIPHNPNLNVPNLNRSGVPAFKRSHAKFYTGYAWTPGQAEEAQAWQRRTRQGDSMAAGFGHSWHAVLDENLYFKEHPEWYALVNGKRTFAQICTSNMEMRNEFVKRLLALPANQKLQILSVSPSDGYGFCECPLCRSKSDDKMTYSEYITAADKSSADGTKQNVGYQGFQHAAYWDFVNDIAKRVKVLRPDLGIGSLAYTMARQPPKNIERLPDNVFISMTSYATQLMLPNSGQEYAAYLDSWKAKGVKLVIYEYWGMWYWMDLPVLYPREIANEIKMAHAAGTVGMYGEASKNFANQALNYYVLTRQLWDPQGTDPEKSMDKFFSVFGPASSEVRNYFDAMNDGVRKTWREKALIASYVRVVASFNDMFDKETLARAKAALDAADAKTGNDAILKKRLAFLRAGYEYTELMAELLGLYEKLGRTGFPLEFFEWQSTAAPGRAVTNNTSFSDRREFFEANLRQPFSYTLAEQDEWMRQAWDLGQKRIQMMNANRGTFAFDEGYYGRQIERGLSTWHGTIARYLGKTENDIIPLEFTLRKPLKDSAARPVERVSN